MKLMVPYIRNIVKWNLWLQMICILTRLLRNASGFAEGTRILWLFYPPIHLILPSLFFLSFLHVCSCNLLFPYGNMLYWKQNKTNHCPSYSFTQHTYLYTAYFFSIPFPNQPLTTHQHLANSLLELLIFILCSTLISHVLDASTKNL